MTAVIVFQSAFKTFKQRDGGQAGRVGDWDTRT
jgi:DNA-binding transcriptional regulator of glucitol operon